MQDPVAVRANHFDIIYITNSVIAQIGHRNIVMSFNIVLSAISVCIEGESAHFTEQAAIDGLKAVFGKTDNSLVAFISCMLGVGFLAFREGNAFFRFQIIFVVWIFRIEVGGALYLVYRWRICFK